MHKTIVAVIVFFSTLFHSPAFSGQKFNISQSENQDVTIQATKALPYIIKACPGLEKYADDLSSAEARQSPLLEPGYEGGLLLEFVVSEHPKKLPRPLNIYSKGNHCFINVSTSADKMYISKRACHSLCTGIWTENTPGEMGREFDLVP